MLEPDRVIFKSSVAMAGEFRCPVDHPRFEDSGPTRQHCFVFPRNAVWIEHEGDRPFVADANVVPLYNPGRSYRRGRISDAGDASDWFGVTPAVLREMVAHFDPSSRDVDDRRLFARGSVAASAATFLLQRRVFEHLKAGPPDVMFVEESVLGVLSDVLDRVYTPVPRAAPAAHIDVVQRAREHLARTFLLKESVGDVAQAAGASVFHLCRMFRCHTGFSLHRYRTELRLRRSLDWLHGGADILTVALAAGFSHHSHFTAAFRRTFGMRPSDWRRVGGISTG